MKEHPINEILKTSLENIDELVNTNKAFGEPIVLPDDVIVIPVSKVIYGYGVGGSQFNKKPSNTKSEIAEDIYPFGGGSGGGVTINPTALIIIKGENIKKREESYTHSILLDDEQKVLREAKRLLKEKCTIYHVSSAII